MLYQKLKEKKKELGLTTERLSQLSGIPAGTINKILSGETRSPRYDTLKSLEEVLFNPNPAGTLSESSPAYNSKGQGTYTIEDYYNLPDNVRAELIDGSLIYMEAPSFTHQDLITSLLFEFESYIRDRKGPCKVLTAPLDVQLDCDDQTMVQPDIVITCKKEQRTEKGIYGAPDMCIEIVSDSSRKRDFVLKVTKYMEAGVREYWIVDSKRESIICYNFESEDYPYMYTFQDKVPVQIYQGNLEIDFAMIKEHLHR